ncbi:hypothetical protein [Parasutterella sp.]|uniref:hypothetical protein n=1 Tax=Parasutterella sp. TaxID=2049037 RepID=UPI003080B925
MKAQAHFPRPSLSCIFQGMDAVRDCFCKTGAGDKNSTQLRQERPATGSIFPKLYGFYLSALQFSVSVKATDTGLRNLNMSADNRHGENQNGFSFIRKLSHLLMGVACSCDLSHGYRYGRISQNCNAMPTRLRNGRMVSKNLTISEANNA